MDSSSNMGEPVTTFYVGHHETKRDLPVSDELVPHAHDLGVRF